MGRVSRGRPKNAIPQPYPKKVGKSVIYYYSLYDDSGKRRFLSTGCTKRAEAVRYIRSKIENDDLYPTAIVNFKRYAENFFQWADKDAGIEASLYVRERNRKGGRPITREYAYDNSVILSSRVLPEFGALALDQITPVRIDNWTSRLLAEGLSTSTVKKAYLCLNTILTWAFRKGDINRNPFERTTPISVTNEERGSLSMVEAHAVLKREHYDNEQVHLANVLAAITGMRLSELVAIEVDALGDDRILVSQAKRRLSGVTEGTKNKTIREIPVPPEMIKKLRALRGSGYVFSFLEGKLPMDEKWPRIAFNLAVGAAKINRSARALTFHSWRHFLTTQLGAANVSAAKIAAVRGDKTGTMVERYTHFKADDMREVYAVQRAVLGGVGLVQG